MKNRMIDSQTFSGQLLLQQECEIEEIRRSMGRETNTQKWTSNLNDERTSATNIIPCFEEHFFSDLKLHCVKLFILKRNDLQPFYVEE